MGWFDKIKRKKAEIEPTKHTKHKILPKKVLTIIRKYARLGYTNSEIADEIEKSGFIDYRPAEPTISSWVHASGLIIKRKKIKKAKIKKAREDRLKKEREAKPKKEFKEFIPVEKLSPTIPVIPLGSKGNLKPTQLSAIGWKQNERIKEQEEVIKIQKEKIKTQEQMVKEYEKRDAQPRPKKKGGYIKVKDLYDPKKSGMTEFEANHEHIKMRKKAHDRKGKKWQESPAHHGTKQKPNVCPACPETKPKWATHDHDQPMQRWIQTNRIENFELNRPEIEYKEQKERERRRTEMLEPQRQPHKEKAIDDGSRLIIPDELIPMEKVSDRYQSKELTKDQRSFYCGKCNNLINYPQFTRTRAIGGVGLCRGCENKPSDEKDRGGFIL